MDDKNPQYTDMETTWRKCRDASIGQRAVHKGREKYLPKLSGQGEDAYKAYLARAAYFNATGRTIEAMVGLVFRKAPVVEMPPAMTDWKDDINLAGLSLEGFARQAVEEVLTVGRAGILVDYPPQPEKQPGTALTVEQSRQLGLRPYMVMYKAEDILNWKVGRVGNQTRLIRVTLAEIYEDEKGDPQTQVRELTFEDRRYIQIVWREAEGKWYEYQRIEPRRNKTPLTQIPFYFLAPQESDAGVMPPPIEDLANVNISHYQNSADIENGAHLSGLPTPYVTGVDDDDFVFHLGGGGIKLPDTDSKVGFLQCGTEGFATLEKLMDRKEQQMAALGARMLSPEKRQAEAAEAHAIKRGGENSVLSALVSAVEMQIEKALYFMAEWDGISGDIRFTLNKDFIPTPMTAPELTALVGAWQSGAISMKTLFDALKAGEIIDDSVSFDDEQERKEAEAPALGMMNDDQ